MLKESTHQEDITILNMYAPNNKASKYMKQKLIKLKGEIDKSKIIAGDFKSTVSATDTTNIQKISKNLEQSKQSRGSN